MFFSRSEIFAWVAAVLLVVVMGIIAFTGPYHHINKVAAKPQFPTVHVQIVTDPKTIGKYTPGTITVHVNQPVVFTNVSNADHTVTDQQNLFNSGNLAINSSWTLIPKKTGTFRYYCIYHQYMLGTVIVKP
jgi:plastocyanin